MKNRIEVSIGGKSYKISGVESEEYIQRVARYIDKKMMEISGAERPTVLSNNMIAILTAINVADDYFKEKQKNEELLKELEEGSKIDHDSSIEMYEQIIGSLQDENIELKNKLEEVIIEFNNAKSELNEYIENFDKGKT